MNAGPLSLVSLITSSNQRLVIPVYQRAYSWDEEQCEQLWDDILSIGRREEGHHFTGSIVWVQDGTMSATGVTPLLLIDGQQRITTLMLLLVAMAEYARNHQSDVLSYSYEEIMGSGYLINQYKKGDDRYKLVLSQGDRLTFCSIIDNLCDADVHVDESSRKLIDNLEFFNERLASLDDTNTIWRGIQRLEIVSISLTQGQDNPQLIFESLNSTGKDLSSADLIRNFVLMGLPMDEQERLYRNHWRVIEETLGADSYDAVFDDFIRNYLTVIYAPESLVKRDVYTAFKRHVLNNGYDKDSNMVILLKEIERYARYYAAITMDGETDGELKLAFENLAQLDASTLNPLLLSIYNDYDEGEAFTHDDFLAMLRMLDSYVLRRAVCGCASNSFNKFFPSLIARLNKVREDGGNYREALTAMLLNEAGTNRRFPGDAEFERELKARDAYHFQKCFYLLSRLENSYHLKDQRDFASGEYTIEHIMPQNALAHEEWISMLGDGYEETFETGLNNLGNLTLTAYNSELSDGIFEQKKARAEGGYNNEYITISKRLREVEKWDASEISVRADDLAGRALLVWPIPELPDEVKAVYLAERKSGNGGKSVQLRELFNAGRLKPGDVLVSTSPAYGARATITDSGLIILANGEAFSSPSPAAIKAVALAGGKISQRNGWRFWKLGDDGSQLDDLKRSYLAGAGGKVVTDLKRFRIMFWDGFYEHCASMPNFVGAFGDMSERAENPECWASFGIGVRKCHLDVQVLSRDGFVMGDIYCEDAESYRALLSRQTSIEAVFKDDAEKFQWDGEDAQKKSRTAFMKHVADFDTDDWDELYEWMANWLLRMKAAVVGEA